MPSLLHFFQPRTARTRSATPSLAPFSEEGNLVFFSLPPPFPLAFHISTDHPEEARFPPAPLVDSRLPGGRRWSS